MPTHQNVLYIQVTSVDGLMSAISSYDSSLLVSLWTIREGDNGTKCWLLCVRMKMEQNADYSVWEWHWNKMLTTLCGDDNGTECWLLCVRVTMEQNADYSVCQTQCPNLYIVSQDFSEHWSCSLYKFQKIWSTSFNSHINVAWLYNLWFDYSKAFGGFTWLHVI